MKRILIAGLEFDFKQEPRIHRQILSLKKDYEIFGVGLAPSGFESKFFRYMGEPAITRTERIRRLVDWGLLNKNASRESSFIEEIRTLIDQVSQFKYDAIIANNLDSLILAMQIDHRKVLFDSQEYLPRQFDANILWRLRNERYVHYILSKYINMCRGVMVESPMTREEYLKNYDIKPGIHVVPNASPFQELEPSPVDPSKIRIVHHGIASKERKTELMIDMAKDLDERFELNFIFVNNNGKYCSRLKEKAARYKNIHFFDPVPMPEIAEYINRFDIGLFLLSPSNFHYRLTLPNKFFEFVQARLCLAVGPTPQMAGLTKEYGLGVVSSTFSPKELAWKINTLTFDQIRYHKNQSHKHAYDLSFEPHIQKIRNMVDELIS